MAIKDIVGAWNDAADGLQKAATEIGGKIKDIAAGANIQSATLGQSKYNFNQSVFPLDLANEYNGHYMVININVPVNRAGERRGQYSGGYFGTMLNNEYSKVDTLRFGQLGGLPAGAAQREGLSVPRYTRRIAESIALFMPSSIVFTHNNAYDDISLTAIAGQIGVGALNRMATVFGGTGGLLVGAITNGVGSNIGPASRLVGYPINPRVEIMYATTPQRQFVFEILMAPRNEAESLAMQNIVRTLRFHAAPEIDTNTAGLTFIPPAEFDITWYNKGSENLSIPRINTCVLNRLDFDVAPTGVYSTFSNGHPVAARLSMAFTEIEILHKARVAQGF